MKRGDRLAGMFHLLRSMAQQEGALTGGVLANAMDGNQTRAMAMAGR